MTLGDHKVHHDPFIRPASFLEEVALPTDPWDERYVYLLIDPLKINHPPRFAGKMLVKVPKQKYPFHGGFCFMVIFIPWDLLP